MFRFGVFLFLILVAGVPLKAAVDFEKDVAPIFRASCLSCHGVRVGLGNVRIHTQELLSMQSTLGPLVTPGDPDKSSLFLSLMLPKGNPKAMPPGGPLPDAQRQLVRQWILEGARWPEGFEFTARPPAPARRKPTPSPTKSATSTAPAKAAPAEVVPKEDDMVLVEAARARILKKSAEQAGADMKPYAALIPATDASLHFVPIPGGEFTMGTPKKESGRGTDEGPAHRVKVEPFWMSKFETTWDAYRLFMFATEANEAENPDPVVAVTSRPTAPYVEMSFGMGLIGYPAISMTQHAANKFAQWLSLKTGHFYRLPTEAEWESACRAGSSAAYSFGDDPSQLEEYAWFGANSEDKYQQVGKKKPNAWGLHDMHGNVMEWTLDGYGTSFYGEGGALALNPWNRATEPYPHVARGGSWIDSPADLRCGARMASDESWKIQDPQLPKSIWYHTDAQWLGFRLVRPLKVPTAKEMFAYWNNGVEYD